MTRWGKAGQRLTPGRHDQHRHRAMRARAYRHQHEAEARARWQSGQVVPDRITCALDMRGLEGPEVDAACKAAEPDVDRWEAGDLYPSWDQLCALSALTQFPVGFFVRPAEPLPDDGGSLRFHFPDFKPRKRITEFTPAALAWAAAEYGVTS